MSVSHELHHYVFDAQAVGAFAQLIVDLRQAKTKKERAKFVTMISGFVRSMQYLRTDQSINGDLIEIRERFDIATGKTAYDFIFEVAVDEN